MNRKTLLDLTVPDAPDAVLEHFDRLRPSIVEFAKSKKLRVAELEITGPFTDSWVWHLYGEMAGRMICLQVRVNESLVSIGRSVVNAFVSIDPEALTRESWYAWSSTLSNHPTDIPVALAGAYASLLDACRSMSWMMTLPAAPN